MIKYSIFIVVFLIVMTPIILKIILDYRRKKEIEELRSEIRRLTNIIGGD